MICHRSTTFLNLYSLLPTLINRHIITVFLVDNTKLAIILTSNDYNYRLEGLDRICHWMTVWDLELAPTTYFTRIGYINLPTLYELNGISLIIVKTSQILYNFFR